MTIEGLLFIVLQFAVVGNWVVAAILIRAHRRSAKPPRALTVMAVSTVLVALALSTYVLAVLNAGVGYLIPKEAGQVALRFILCGLALFPYWFLWLYLTGRFRQDDEEGAD